MTLTLDRPALFVPDIDDDATRRGLLTGGLSMAALLVLAGCGGDSDAEPAASPDTIDFAHGDFRATVPRNPERVVVIEGRGDLDFALSVGYPVVATGSLSGDALPDGPFEGLVESATVLQTSDGVNMEQLVALRPDLIVMRLDSYTEDYWSNSRLKEIAPILAVGEGKLDWRGELTAQADLLGRREQVDTVLATYDQKLADATAELGAALTSAKVALTAVIDANTVLVFTAISGMQVLADLGVQQPFLGVTENSNGSSISLSQEELGQLSDVTLILSQVNSDDELAVLNGAPTWSTLPAIEAGHFHGFPAGLLNGLALTCVGFLDEVVAAARLLV